MGRSKVTDDKRVRVIQACNTCKKKKHKCDGGLPCQPCVSRCLPCCYGSIPTPAYANDGRRYFEELGRRVPPSGYVELVPEPRVAGPASRAPWNNIVAPRRRAQVPVFPPLPPPPQFPPLLPLQATSPCRQQGGPSAPCLAKSDDVTGDEAISFDEEVEVRGEIRWLQDPYGRLLYIGEASSLSFLQVVRTEVGIAIEGSPSTLGTLFTEHEMRHRVPKSWLRRSQKDDVPFGLPDQQSASTIADYFFTGTCGLLEILSRQSFDAVLDSFYQDPSALWDSDLCLIHLVLANGLVMARPGQCDPQVSSIMADPRNRADLFFQTGKHVAERVPGFEDGDIWSIQARILKALYSFQVSNWNAAYDYLSSAAKIACSLGFHRIEFPFLDDDAELFGLRRHLWRSIFVLDRLISEFVDRPPAVSECDFSEDVLCPPHEPESEEMPWECARHTHLIAVDAVVTAVRSMRHMIERFHGKASVTTSLGGEALQECRERLLAFPPTLNSFRFMQEQLSPAEGVAILYVNVVEAHCKLLLTRPFFLHVFVGLLHAQRPVPMANLSDLESLAQACLDASMSVVTMIYNAYRSQWLPRRNAFLLNFLFASSLVIMCNELVGMYPNVQYVEMEGNIRTMAADCAGPDAQGQIVWASLSSLGDFVQEQRRMRISAQELASSTSPAAQVTPMPWGPGFRGDLFGTSRYAATLPQPADNKFILGMSGGSDIGSASTAGSPDLAAPFETEKQLAELSGTSFTSIPSGHPESPELTGSPSSGQYAPSTWTQHDTQRRPSPHGIIDYDQTASGPEASLQYSLQPPTLTPQQETCTGVCCSTNENNDKPQTHME